MTQRSAHLFRDILDHELVDVDGISCGMVDDVELGGSADEELVVKALRVGPNAWLPRLPAIARWIVEKIVPHHSVRVPWTEVSQVSEVIKIRSKASALGLGRVDRKAGAWLARIPGS
jgi:sporulation protein YlmC with PRC-barrel domain